MNKTRSARAFCPVILPFLWRVRQLFPSCSGTPVDPDPNKPFAKIDCKTLFNDEGQLNPSITILGSNVVVPAEAVIYNTIVLPHKALNASFKNQIIL